MLYKIHVDNFAVNRKKRKVNFAGSSARRYYFCSVLNNPCDRKPKYCDNALERACKRCGFVRGCGDFSACGDEEDEEIAFPKAEFEMNFAVRRLNIFYLKSEFY